MLMAHVVRGASFASTLRELEGGEAGFAGRAVPTRVETR
jgi:hypothetical protein